MKDERIINEVMSQQFKIEDDYTYENVADALDNYSDKIFAQKNIELEQILHEVSQVFDGWKQDDPKAWSEYDTQVRNRIDKFRIKYTYNGI